MTPRLLLSSFANGYVCNKEWLSVSKTSSREESAPPNSRCSPSRRLRLQVRWSGLPLARDPQKELANQWQRTEGAPVILVELDTLLDAVRKVGSRDEVTAIDHNVAGPLAMSWARLASEASGGEEGGRPLRCRVREDGCLVVLDGGRVDSANNGAELIG